MDEKDLADILSMEKGIINGEIKKLDDETKAKRWADALKKNGASTSCTLQEAKQLIEQLQK